MSTPDGSLSASRVDFQANLAQLDTAANQVAMLSESYLRLLDPIPGAVEGTVAGNAGLPSFNTLAQFFTSALVGAARQVAEEFDTQSVLIRQTAKHFEEVDLEQEKRAAELTFDGRLPGASGSGVA